MDVLKHVEHPHRIWGARILEDPGAILRHMPKLGGFWHLNIESRGQRGGCSIPRFDDSNGVYDGMEV